MEAISIHSVTALEAQEGTSSSKLRWSQGYLDLLAGNPHVRDEDTVGFYLSVNGVMASSILLIPDEVVCRGKRIRLFWGQDFLTREEFRGRGLGTKLIAGVIDELHGRNIALGAFAMSKSSKRVWQKCGMVDLEKTPRYFIMLDAKAVCHHHMKSSGIRVAANVGGNCLLGIWYGLMALCSVRQKAQYCMEEQMVFDEHLDQWLRGHSAQLWCERSVELLNWKLLHARKSGKGKQFDAYIVRNLARQRIEGYCITRTGVYQNFAGRSYENLKIMSLLDFYIEPDNKAAQKAMLAHLVEKARDQKCAFMEMMTSNRPMQQTMGRMLFVRKGGYELCFSVPSRSPLDDPFCRQRSNWWITMGESDAFFF